jgi:hypothetical protein
MLQYLHAVLKLAVNCAVNTISNTAANLKGLNVEFFKSIRHFCIYA